ncbi:hypothetical protein DVH26_27755 [Paenibacillus sp. H1-7]|uniref:hypothetical protein n=1 Tax=Paenibacillus sp. H1-7 TaxID=2282849 RepID=UPI001EF96F04|nr:hypothetical protein [Paenibacillus sp. H1-7]ULL17925.1 hypothetical protein DVH26_27755 [Paenibacillus sp. H1-7]
MHVNSAFSSIEINKRESKNAISPTPYLTNAMRKSDEVYALLQNSYPFTEWGRVQWTLLDNHVIVRNK